MDPYLRFILLLVIEGVGFLSVRGTNVKDVCPGDSVEMFQNIDFDICNSLISLSVNGKRNTEIATWLLHNCTLKTTVDTNYKGRIFFNQNGTLTINNIHHFDQGKYTVMSKKDTFPSVQEVEIKLMVTPSKNCKPMIKKVGEKLVATVQHVDCGRPIATPYWTGSDDISDIHEPTIKIRPDNKPRTYTACIEGPALRCEKNLTPQDFCSPFVTNGTQVMPGDTSRTESPVSSSTPVYIAFIIVLVILLVAAVVIIVILILKLRGLAENSNKEQTTELLEVHPKGETRLEQITEERVSKEQLWEKHFDTLRWNDIKSLLNHEQLLELQTNFETFRATSNENQQDLGTRLEEDQALPGNEAEDRSGADPEKIRLLQELRDTANCKICYTNKMSVFFMPCNHIASCSNCSVNLTACPVCRAAIQEKMNICF